MFGSGVIDTAIGLVFVFLLVSMIVTIVNEMVSAALLSRAKWLRIGIDRLLGSKWAQELYDHPLIDGSARNPRGTTWTLGGMRGDGPSYIPSRSFANVLLDLVHRGDSTLSEARRRLQEGLDSVSTYADLRGKMLEAAAALRPSAQSVGTLAEDLDRLMSGLSGKQTDLAAWSAKLAATAEALADPALAPLKTALSQLAGKAAGQKGADPGSIEPLVADLQKAIDSVPYVAVAEAIKRDLGSMFDALRAGYTLGDARNLVQRFISGMPARYLREVIRRFPDEKVRDTLLVLLDDAENDVEKFKENVEIWFNNAMDRVSGWYKRRSQWVIAILSLGATLFMNVDAILVVKYLDTHPGIRDALVTQAKAYADSNSTAAKAAAPASSPVGTTGVQPPALVAVSGERFVGVLAFAQPASEPGKVQLISSSGVATLRDTVVAASKGASSVEFAFDSKPATAASSVTITASGVATGAVTVRLDASLVAKLDDVHDQLLQLNLPIGWVREGTSPGEQNKQHGTSRKPPSQSERDNLQVLPTSWQAGVDVLSFHILGWILTALAASLGAPFWFDTLNRFISIRSAGKAPEESPKPPKNVPVPLEPGQSPREADLQGGAHR